MSTWLHPWISPWIRQFSPSLLPSPGGALPLSEPRADWVEKVWRTAGLNEGAAGSMTLLAPCDEALDRCGLDLGALPVPALQAWLMRHLVEGRVDACPVIETLDGGLLHQQSSEAWLDASARPFRRLGTTVSRSGLTVLVIDRPLERAKATLWQLLREDPSLSGFAQALDVAGLAPMLAGQGGFTVFAPDNEAMDLAAAHLGLSRSMLRRSPERLTPLLMAHVAPGRWSRARLPWGGSLRTWAPLPMRLTPLGRLVSGEQTLPLLGGSDQCASNGVLHRLPGLLLPAS